MNIINLSVPAGVSSPVAECGAVMIGYVGENGVTKVVLDVSAWSEAYGDGVITLGIQRSGDPSWYPVALTVDGTTAAWLVSKLDTNVEGMGVARFSYTVGGAEKRSAVWKFFVDRGLQSPEGEAPDPYESWVETLTGLGAETLQNAQDARAAAEDAEAAARNAGTAAEAAGDARTAAEAAQAAAETAEGAAGGSARDAAQSAATAREAAQEAGNAAVAAAGSASTAERAATAAAERASTAESAATAAAGSAALAGQHAEKAETAVSHYPKIVSGYWQVWDPENGQYVNTGVKAEGENGLPGKDGDPGAPGQDGATFTPTVSTDGIISWTNDGGLPNPQPRNIMGPEGKPGKDGAPGPAPDMSAYRTAAAQDVIDAAQDAKLEVLRPAASAQDVGKALIVKTVADGKATAYEFGEAGGGGGDVTTEQWLYSFPTGQASGAPASFDDGGDGLPIRALSVYIAPNQSGSGDPAPDNVRPITGWTGLTLSRSGEDTSAPDTYAVTFTDPATGDPLTVYGGKLMIHADGSGELVSSYRAVMLDSLNYNDSLASSGVFRATLSGLEVIAAGKPSLLFCTKYKTVAAATASVASDRADYSVFQRSGYNQIYVKDTNCINYTAAQFKQYVSGVLLCYQLAEDAVYPLSPGQVDALRVNTLRGTNNIWADTGNVSVEYRADPGLFAAAKDVIDKSALYYTKQGSTDNFFNSFISPDGTFSTSTKTIVNGRPYNFTYDHVKSIKCQEGYSFIVYGFDTSFRFLGSLKSDGTFTTDASDVPRYTEFDLDDYPDVLLRFGLNHFVDGSAVDITPGEANVLTLTYTLNKALANRSLSVIGDSISTFTGYANPNAPTAYYPRNAANLRVVDQMYWKALAERNGMTIDTIDSYGGSTVGTKWKDDVDYTPFTDESRLSRLGNPDYIIVEGGINDFGGNPLGEYPSDGNYSSMYEFRTSYAYLLNQLKIRYPYARIVCMSLLTPKTYNNTQFPEKQSEVKQALSSDKTPHYLYEFNDSIKELCARYGCVYCNIYDIVNYYVDTTSSLGPHPFDSGHYLIANRLESLLKDSGV